MQGRVTGGGRQRRNPLDYSWYWLIFFIVLAALICGIAALVMSVLVDHKIRHAAEDMDDKFRFLAIHSNSTQRLHDSDIWTNIHYNQETFKGRNWYHHHKHDPSKITCKHQGVYSFYISVQTGIGDFDDRHDKDHHRDRDRTRHPTSTPTSNPTSNPSSTPTILTKKRNEEQGVVKSSSSDVVGAKSNGGSGSDDDNQQINRHDDDDDDWNDHDRMRNTFCKSCRLRYEIRVVQQYNGKGFFHEVIPSFTHSNRGDQFLSKLFIISAHEGDVFMVQFKSLCKLLVLKPREDFDYFNSFPSSATVVIS